MPTAKALGRIGTAGGIVLIALFLSASHGSSQAGGPTTHNIFVSALEVKGGTTADKLAPPSTNPKDISKGYEFKPPGEADRANPKRWEVSSYLFSPGFVAVRQGDRVNLTVFIVNGDEHESWVTDPDGS